MSDERKRSRRAWIAWALVAIFAYPLSMGPLLWVAGRMTEEFDNPRYVSSALKFYGPLLSATRATGTTPLLEKYVNLFASWGFSP
jgi:hypothetical protein